MYHVKFCGLGAWHRFWHIVLTPHQNLQVSGIFDDVKFQELRPLNNVILNRWPQTSFCSKIIFPIINYKPRVINLECHALLETSHGNSKSDSISNRTLTSYTSMMWVGEWMGKRFKRLSLLLLTRKILKLSTICRG